MPSSKNNTHDYVKVERGWGYQRRQSTTRSTNQGTPQSSSYMMQQWLQEPARDGSFNAVGEVKTASDKTKKNRAHKG